MKKELRELIKTLAKHQYKVTEINQKGKHIKLRINNKWVIVSSTPRRKGEIDKRTLSYLRREEAKV